MSVTALSPRHPAGHRVFPVFSVEHLHFDLRYVNAVKAAHVDVDLIRVGTRHVERMNAARGAERVLRHAGVESIGGQRVLAAQKLESLGRDDQMQESLLGAY